MKKLIAALALLCLAALPVSSQAPPARDEAVHNELRTLRDGLVDAMNKGDIERQLTYLHPNIVVTALNGEVSRGREGVRAYFLKMTTGPNRVVESFHCDVMVDELTILYGADTGISFGSAVQSYKLTDGLKLDAKTRWTATLVKDHDHWLVASLHASANLFDNPLLAMAKRTAYWAGGVSLLAGLIIGFFLTRRRKEA
jgi:ketosteroid isomerase-like protein